MENNKNINTEEVAEELSPLFGVFKMSKVERIVHASVFCLIGAAYFAFVIWSKTYPGFKASDIVQDISTWQVIPCYILSVLILLSAFPVKGDRIFAQQFLRGFMMLSWLIIYMEISQIVFILFYKYLPA